MKVSEHSYSIIPMQRTSISEFLCQLRPEDLNELHASGWMLENLRSSLTKVIGVPAYATKELRHSATGRLLAVGGVIPRDDGTGAPWFLCTVYAKDYPITLLRALKEEAKAAKAAYTHLHNRYWVPNTMHGVLIRKLGFTTSQEVDPSGFAAFWWEEE